MMTVFVIYSTTLVPQVIFLVLLNEQFDHMLAGPETVHIIKEFYLYMTFSDRGIVGYFIEVLYILNIFCTVLSFCVHLAGSH